MLTLDLLHLRALLLLRRRPALIGTGAFFSLAGGYVAFWQERRQVSRYIRAAADGLAGAL